MQFHSNHGYGCVAVKTYSNILSGKLKPQICLIVIKDETALILLWSSKYTSLALLSY